MKKKINRAKTGLSGIARKEKRLEKGLERRFHAFMNEWQAHIKEEIAIHEALLKGKRSFAEHLGDTRRIHENFLKKLRKL
ncbi:MAG: hypothetical protein V1817_04580 [Candidatus Micrarchaeota archaeon]